MSRPKTARTARAKLLVVLGVVGLAAIVTAISLAASPPAAPTLTTAPPAPSASTSASFAFTGPGGATLECRLDASSFAACTSPKTYTGLALGSHTFHVRATKSGQTSSETTYTWSVVVPTATIATSPLNPTNSQSASFTFTADASNATFECKLDAGAFGACTSPKSYSGLAGGSHTFQVRALGSAGTGAAASRTWAVDVTPPAAPAITGGPPASPAWTSSTSAMFTFTGETGATFQCKLDGAAFAACSAPRSYTGLAQGSHTFQVLQIDTAGNQGPAASRTFLVDSVAPPSPSITSKPANPTSSTSATFAFSDSEGGVSFLCQLDGGGFAGCTSPMSYGGPLAQGPHTFQVEARDAAGNTSAAATWTWTVDTTPPNTPTITFAPLAYPPAGWSSTSATFMYSDDSSDVVSYQCKLDAGSYVACASATTYSGLAQGPHTFQVEAVDSAGNVSSGSASWTFFVDTVGPTRPAFSQTPPDPSSSASATFAWSSTDPAPSSEIAGYLCSKENGSYVPCSSPLTYTVEATNNGQHQFAVVSVDRAGNMSPVASYTWKVATDSGKSFTIAGSVSGLVPGAWQSIPITITNPNNQVLYVTSLSVTASGAPGGCDSSTNIETQPSSAAPANKLAVPANAVNWPVPAGSFRPQIRLRNTTGNQDNCKSQTFGLSFAGSGTNEP